MLTKEQVTLWLEHPVTKAYLECLSYCDKQANEALLSGTHVVPGSADATLYNHTYFHSRKCMLAECSDPMAFLGKYEKQEVAHEA